MDQKKDEETITLGVIADTHIPDRVESLHPGVLPLFEAAGVRAILHAGDISVPGVLSTLERVAPVCAVRGNRDWLHLGNLPKTRRLAFGGVQIGLAHGHGGLRFYFREKVHVLTVGYRLDFYLPYLFSACPGAQVIVFGHSHMPVVHRVNGKLIVNPGSPCCPDSQFMPSAALLRIKGGQPSAEIVWLERQG